MDFDIIVNVLGSTIRLSVPLIFAALAGLYSERAGVFDIGLEGKMLGAAFAAGAVAYVTGSALVALGAAILTSVALSLVHGFASISQRGNQIVSGVAINFFAAGMTVLLGQYWFGQSGRTPIITGDGRFTNLAWPFAEEAASAPLIGPTLGAIYAHVISGHNLLVYLAFVAIPVTWWVLARTRFGLRLRAVGENPAAVDTAGISVTKMRYQAVMCCGLLCGFAGAYLSIAQSAGFIRNMTAGQGFIALAALIFAKWRPVSVMWASLLFGFLAAFSIRIEGTELPIIGHIPGQVFQALPYVLTVILLAGFVGKAIPPKAGGVPYVKERG